MDIDIRMVNKELGDSWEGGQGSFFAFVYQGMKQWSTSTRVSVWLSVVATGMVAFFALLVNIFFLTGWLQQEGKNLRNPPEFSLELQPGLVGSGVETTVPGSVRGARPMRLGIDGGEQRRPQPVKLLVQHFQRSIVLDSGDARVQAVMAGRKRRNVSLLEGRWYMFRAAPKKIDKVVIVDVTRLVERQVALLHLSFWCVFLCAVLSFAVARGVIGRVLRDIDRLADFVDGIDIDHLEQELVLDHLPDNDQVQRVAAALHTMMARVREQVGVIKRFVSCVSHEFKTPLMAMQTTTELALARKRYRAGLDKNLMSIAHLQRLLDSLLLLTKADAGMGPSTEQVCLAPLVQSCAAGVAERYADKYIALVMELDEKVEMMTHRGSVEMIVTNILENAYKYTPASGRVQVVLTDKKLEIVDTGVGMDEEMLEFLWEPFWQADSSKGQDQGFGLGMSIVQSLIATLGWQIDVTSEIDQGTHFVIRFA